MYICTKERVKVEAQDPTRPATSSPSPNPVGDPPTNASRLPMQDSGLSAGAGAGAMVLTTDSSSTTSDELKRMPLSPLRQRKLLSKQLSMRETSLEAAWERRRLQRLRAEQDAAGSGLEPCKEDGFRSPRLTGKSITDEDLRELKGSIELGFGFKEEHGQELCDTLPALDLYFAVTRQLSDSRIKYSPSISSATDSPRSSESSSPTSTDESWKICNPGDNPQHVKTRLRHWAQAVACSVRQSC